NLAIKTNDTSSFNYFIRGQVYETMGDDFKAGLDFNEAIDRNPLQADYYYSRGGYYFRLGKYEEATTVFSSAIVLAPHIADYYFQRGYCYYIQQKLDFALIDIRDAIKRDSLQANYWLGLGATQEAAGNKKSAMDAYNHTIALDPTNALAYFNRAN